VPGGEPSLVELTLDDTGDGRTRMVVVEVPLPALRAVAARTVWASAAAGRARGPRMAVAA
jgi:hypothetical protein